MQRRSFLKAAALAGLAISAPVITRDAGASAPYGGPFYIMVNAGGGWDPTFMFNPTLNQNHNRLYTEIKKIGNISYAPIPLDLAAMGLDTTTGYDPT
ncbi:MAG: twin-arginine translocation signal domain-containing protein [Myxococcales bacterium]|nr:twin-arginine translocation signal domain-containing protein [Myxococcales bacterium]